MVETDASPINDTEHLNETLEKFGHTLSQWAAAYPLSVFPEPDLTQVRGALEAAGITIDSVSASSMRHVVTRLDKEFQAVRDALSRAGQASSAAATESKRVPCLSTAEMNDAGLEVMKRRHWATLGLGPSYIWSDMEAVFAAMVAAAPQDTPDVRVSAQARVCA